MPTFELKLSDGTYSIEAPDEQTAIQISNEYMQGTNQTSEPTPPVQQGNPVLGVGEAPAPDSWMAQLGSAPNEAIASIGGLPMDMARGTVNLMGADIPTDAWGGSEYIRNKMTDAGLIQPESQDPAQQVARRSLKMATEAVLPLGAAAKFANTVKSPVLKEALMAVVNNPMKVLGLETASGGSAGLLGGVTEQFTDNPYAIAGAEFLGGFSPLAIGSAAKKIMGAGDNVAKTVADFKSIGATPTVAQATGGNIAGSVEKVSAMIPFGGSRFRKNAQKTYSAITDTIAKHVDDMGGTDITKQEVGGVVRKGLQGFSDKAALRAEELYSKVDRLVPKQTPVTMTRTKELIEEITGSIEGAGSVSKAMADKELNSIATAIIQDAGADGSLPYEALKVLRKRIWKKASNFSNESAGDYKRLYGAIVEDANAAASAISPQASNAVKQANKYYSGFNKRIDEHLKKVMDKLDDSHITDMLELSGKKGSTQLNAVKKSLTPDEWDLYVSRQVDNLGKAKDSPDFSTDIFVTQYKKLSPEIKNVLFSGNKEMRRDLETIFRVSKNLKLDKAILNNPSGTADKGFASLLTLGAYFNPALATKAGIGIAGNKMLSIAMTSPKTLSWLAKGVKMRPEALAGHITRLAAIARRGDQNDRDAALEIINILSPSEDE